MGNFCFKGLIINKMLILLLMYSSISYGQKFSSEKGAIVFFSDADIEDIKAVNAVVGSLFNTTTGEIVYILKIRDFVFDNSLMREHFNEKYLESEKYPKATFQGTITGFKENTNGLQKVKAVGKMTMHGVAKEVSIPGTIERIDGKLVMKSKFRIKLQDYNIKIPKIVWQNIAEEVEVTVDIIYKPV